MSKREKRALRFGQVFLFTIVTFLFLLKVDRWFFEAYYQSIIFPSVTLSVVEYKFPLLDIMALGDSKSTEMLVFFIIDWLAYFVLISGLLTGNFIVTGLGSVIIMICSILSSPSLFEVIVVNHYDYKGLDPLIDYLTYGAGHIATVFFQGLTTEPPYDELNYENFDDFL
jgi:hypothetical protein